MNRASQILRVVIGAAIRGISIAAGIFIEYRQVAGREAQLDLIGLGLLLICVPPASWLDTVSKLSRVADAVGAAANEAGSSEAGHPMRRSEDRPPGDRR